MQKGVPRGASFCVGMLMSKQFKKFEDRNNFKFNLTEGAEYVGKYGLPKLRRSDYAPRKLTPFNLAMTHKTPGESCVHFFVDDYQFERLWNYPEKYLNVLKRFEGVITPDFSMLSVMPAAQRIWNCYRNRALAFWMQKNGIRIVPAIGWTYYEELDWCLDGLPKQSSIAIETHGCIQNPRRRYGLLKGMERIAKELEPVTVICYGGEIESVRGLFKNIVFYENYCKVIQKRVE